jgi:radical SAM protein with 4Fe4S-binding SPASM domain
VYNVMLTNVCNQKCPYCFAKGLVNIQDNAKPKGVTRHDEISLADLKTIISIFKRWGIDEFRLIGGEPTLHPQFRRIIELLQTNGFKIHLFTNGLLKKDLVDFLAKKEGITYLVNHLPPDFYRVDRSSPGSPAIDYLLSKCGRQVCLGVSIYTPDFDLSFVIDKVIKFGLKKAVRIGFAHPICIPHGHAMNEYLPLEDYRLAMPGLVRFSRDCDKHNIRVEFDCVAILCAFSKEEYGELYCNVGALPSMVCTPVIDIGTDLRVWRCFVTSGMYNERKLTDFENPQEITDYFNGKFEKFQRIGGMDQCFRCKYMKRGQCQGGCIGHTLNKFEKISRANKAGAKA